MPLELSLLNYNLPSLYAVAQQDPKDKAQQPITLVANYAGTHIYNAAYGWGRLWKILYAIIGLFDDTIKTKKMHQALMKTHEAFKEQLKHVTDYVRKYQTYLEERIEGYDDDHVRVPEDEYFEIGHAISAWNDATLPFLQLIKRKQHAAITEIFRRHTGDNGCDLAKLFPADHLKKCIHFQRIINVEFELDTKIPFEALARLSTGKGVKTDMKKEIRTFVKKANDKADKVGIRLFHRAMRYFMEYVADKKNYEKHLTRMEVKLADEEYGNCKLFVQPDKDHLEWRATLKPGDTITFNGQQNGKQTIVLGEQIGKKAEGTDNNLIFAIKGDDEKVVWITINEVVLSLKQWGRSEYQLKFGRNPNGVLWPVEFYDLDKSGKVAIMERLTSPLDSMEWTSDKPDVISWDDEVKCKDICSMLSDFVTMRYTPFPFSPKHLMLDPHGRVKSTKILYTDPKHPFDFNVLEDFALAFANGRLAVFRNLMTKSGLLKDDYAKYYRRIVKNAMEGTTTTDAATLGTYKNIGDHRIVDRGQELLNAVVALREECCSRLQSKHGRTNDSTLEALVSGVIHQLYKDSGCAGVLWPTLGDDVYTEVCARLKLQPIAAKAKE